MIGCKVAVLGTGHLAALLARSLPRVCRKWIVSPLRSRAQALADEVGAVSSDSPAAVRGAAVVLLTIDGESAQELIQAIEPHLAPDALLVNCVLAVETAELKRQFPDLRIGAAHLMGSPSEVGMGAPAVLLLDHLTEEEARQMADLLSAIGTVELGEESKVRAAFAIAREAVGRLEMELRDRLFRLGWEDAALDAAVRNLAPGLLRSAVEAQANAEFASGEAAEMRRWVEAALRN